MSNKPNYCWCCGCYVPDSFNACPACGKLKDTSCCASKEDFDRSFELLTKQWEEARRAICVNGNGLTIEIR